MPTTPNHGYNVPNEGDEDWHVPLNENFEQYDTDIEIRDTEANASNYDPKEGAKFYATDTGLVTIGDGSQWNPVPTTGPVATFEHLRLDDISPLFLIQDDGQDIVELQAAGVESDGYGEMRLGVRKDSSTLVPVVRADTDYNVEIGGVLGINTQGPLPVNVDGRNNWNLDNNDGDVRIGNSDYRLTMGVALGGGGAGACNIRAKGGIKRLNLGAGTSGHTIQIDPDAVSINGDLDVSGNKNFVQAVDTDDGEREVAYTASEAPTPRTEVSGVATLEDGRAEIDLPEHFEWVTSTDEPLVVETTPYSVDSNGLAAVERSPERLAIADLDGEGDYEFAYTVKGTREGHADKQVVREPTADASGSPSPTSADD
jgi:hypothetical protein